VYIFGASCAVVTSANLTINAFDSNIEVGIETSARDARDLVVWFDELWKLATPVTEPQLREMQLAAIPLRRDFAKLKRRAKAQSKPAPTSRRKTGFSDSLQHALETATRFFVCNTDRRQGDRTPTGGFVLEEEMHTQGFAAAWEEFKFTSHMELVEPGSIIFMFAKNVGIIGVGVATETCETLAPRQRGRITHVHNTVEWRVPARWLEWTDSAGAFAWKSPNFTFWDVSESKYDDFRAGVIAHFVEAE
jgi:hypothetical protein